MLTKPLSVSFVTTGNPSIASFRYRIAVPSEVMPSLLTRAFVDSCANPEADVVVFSKHWTFNDWSYAKFCKLRGQKVVFDVCDDHFSSSLSPHYLRMVDVADRVTCNSEAMQKRILEATGKEADVIPDPVISPKQEYNKDKQARLVWYGQSMNFPGLAEVYTDKSTTPLLVYVGGQRVQIPEYFQSSAIEFRQWHPHCIQEAAQSCSIALLPYRQGKEAKSANRVLEALWSGMPVITDHIPSVDALGETPCIQFAGSFLDEQVQAMHSTDLTQAMSEIQSKIEQEYSPKAVTQKWVQVLGSLV